MTSAVLLRSGMTGNCHVPFWRAVEGATPLLTLIELESLPVDEPLRTRALELLYSLKTTLEVSQNIDEEDRELIMRLSPLYIQRLAEAEEQGKIEGEKEVVKSLLKTRFGSLDEELSKIIEPILSLPPEEFTPLLLQLSREELLERFQVF
ncbi:hypothetical protein [Calothrix sp. NIES-3974]|uniref:hypothetical protein n=1 Tax=Calothrix sp. NIES-3974 TaxID=2005462 RepID=UPI000B5EB8F5|nr:hypothetical protein [Calothrix sp. NIES-3974]BAZ06815.1 hypothetical protein NIES3974_34770 [Calothrix sp. NIES-3974]